MKQLISPTPIIPATGGWCLQYVRQAYGLPARYASATEAWNNSKSQHRDRNFPAGMWTPVWYGIDIEPLGHVVLRAPDGRAFSTSDYSGWPVIHNSLADLEAFYAYYGMILQYRGWTEDVAGYAVMAPSTINVEGTITKETTLSAAEVKQINDHATAQADRVIDYVGKLLVGGYSVGTKKFPGIAAVDINNQQRIDALTALVAKSLATPDLTAEQIGEAVKGALAEGVKLNATVAVNGVVQ